MFISDLVYCVCVLFCMMNYVNNMKVMFSVPIPSLMAKCNTF